MPTTEKNALPALPKVINSGKFTGGHVQGIALDDEHKYIYYSFTTILVKADLEGNVIGTVTGLTGHLGCISFNSEDVRFDRVQARLDRSGNNEAHGCGTCR